MYGGDRMSGGRGGGFGYVLSLSTRPLVILLSLLEVFSEQSLGTKEGLGAISSVAWLCMSTSR